MVRNGYALASALYAVGVLSLGCATAASLQPPAMRSGYAPVNGLKMYYEVYGRANGKIPPLVLLHGGGSTIKTSFGKVLPALARNSFGGNRPCPPARDRPTASSMRWPPNRNH